MCLSIPVKIETIEDDQAWGLIGGVKIKVALNLVDSVQPGDYVLVHTGFAIEKISEAEAKKNLELLKLLEEPLSPSSESTNKEPDI